MVPQQQRRRRRRAAMVRTSERRVVVVRGPGGFGFTIAGQRPCVVSAVAEDGPAERAGLRAGDALLAVDGASVARAPHTSVARLIAAAPGAITLSVAPRESPPTDTEDTEPDERARTRRRHPPPRRRPQPAMLHHPACHSAGTSAVNEILQNLTRAQLSPHQVARLECRAVVAYLGTIETPQAAANAAPANVRTAVRKLRQERRPAAPILLCVLPNSLLLQRSSAQPLAQYPRERIIYVGCGSEVDRRYFGLVTSAEPSDLESAASHSCHVFAVDSRMAEHEAHVTRAREFQIACTRDPVAERCLEFPPSAEYVVGVIRGMYSLPADDCSSPILQQLSKLAVKGDSPSMSNFSRGNRPVLRPRDRRQCRNDERIEGQEFVANSPQPSNHSEITTTSSNSDSGIGFNNDCRNIADRILVVDFANQQPPVNRFRQDMPRRPAGLVGCSSFDADGSFLSNTTPVVDGFGGQGRPLNLDDVILTSDLQTVRHVSPRTEEDSYNYNNVYSNMPSSSRFQNGVVYDQVYTENEGHYELIPVQLDLDSEVDRIGEAFNSVEIYEERRQEYQSNESVENVTVVSGGTSKASMDSVSVYSSKSHEETRLSRRRHLQTSLDDMLVLGLRDQSEGREKYDDDNFVHPASVKFKIRKSKPLNIITKTCNLLVRKSRRSLSASAGDVTSADDVMSGGGVMAGVAAANSEPDLRQSEQSSPFRRWTTGTGAGSSCRHPDHRNMYNKSSCCSSEPLSGPVSVPASAGAPVAGPARWALGLEHLLADPNGARAFAHFLQQEYAAENIRFWWACEQYAQADDATRASLAPRIYSLHLSSGASEPVNVDAGARRAAADNLRLTPPPKDAFIQAQKQIFNVLKLDSYPRFLRSNIHATCARAELRGLPPPYNADNDAESNKLKKSLSNASERRRSGGGSLLPWKLRTNSKDRSTSSEHTAPDVVKAIQPGNNQLCRVLLPDGATSVVGVSEGTVGDLVDRLLARRNQLPATYDVVLNDAQEGESSAVSLTSSALRLAGRECRVEPRCVLRAALADKTVCVRCRPNRKLRHILPVVIARYCGSQRRPHAALAAGAPVSPDTLMQELDGCRLTIVEVTEAGDYRTPSLELRSDAPAEQADIALRIQDVPDAQSSSSSQSSSKSLTSTTSASLNNPSLNSTGTNGTKTGSKETNLSSKEANAGSNETVTGSNGRVRATLRAGPLHHHPPEFLENLRCEQRARLLSRRSPPPLPPKPGPKLTHAAAV